MLRVDSDGIEYDDIVFDSLAPQLHASKVTDDFVVLDPGQGAIVPLTFLPRFPPIKSEGDTLVTLPSKLSPWQQADREGWIGSVSIRNNLGCEVDDPESYRVTTMLLVETNFGVARIPFDANSVRDNPYSLPDVIYFASATDHNPSRETFQSYVAENGIRIMDSHWNAVPSENDDPDPDCYDLYLKHPEDSYSSIDIFLQEISVSRPENVSLRILPEKDPDSNLISCGPLDRIREWTEQGGLLIPPDDEQHYIATICNHAAETTSISEESDEEDAEDSIWMDPLDVDGSLGYLQIRTESETLYVSLFESEESRRETRALRYFSDDTDFSPRYNLSLMPENPVVQGYPEKLEVVLVNGTAHSSSMSLGLLNTDDEIDMTVMKTTLAFHDDDADKLDDLGIEVTIDPAGLRENDWFLGAGERIDDAFFVGISWDLSSVDTEIDYELHGRILVQGSTSYRSTAPWVRAAMQDPSLDADTMYEIPVVLHCVEGRLGIARQRSLLPDSFYHADYDNPASASVGAIEAVFFPDSNENMDRRSEKKGGWHSSKSLEHNLNAYSTANASISLKDVFIEDYNGTKVNGTGTTPCNRFNVTLGFQEKLEISFGDRISDMGSFILRYDFPTGDRSAEEVSPVQCFLTFTTSPDSGLHSFPLLIYTGRVDVSVNEFTKPRDLIPPSLENLNRIQALVGFPQMLDWFQNSKAGMALRSLLGSKRPENDQMILSRYLYGLSRSSFDLESSILNPVLLKVGAINPDEKEIIPLFLTNHNPIPSLLRIDVSEVEGLRMTLGRNPFEGRGSSILAKTPERQDSTNRSATVDHGPFKGQPVEGLAKFLQSDPRAQALLSFSFHDAVELSESAASRQRLLKNIFVTQSTVEFHKDATPPDSSFSIDCTGFGVSQPYSKFVSSVNGNRSSIGPITISPDSKSVRSLPSCGNLTQRTVNDSLPSTILLPAGGVARFDIRLQSPPVALLDQDVSQFLVTGLVLTTENREVMPIFVAFETPRGKLDVSPDFEEEGFDSHSIPGLRTLRVPPGIFHSRSVAVETIVRIPPKSQQLEGIVVSDIASLNASSVDSGVSLFMTSSFKRPVELLDVVTCNPLFEVVLRNGSLASDPVLGVNIGKIRSVVPCTAPAEVQEWLTDSPSFFLCALNWVLGRKDLQPQGCGGRLPIDNQINGTDSRDGARIDFGMANRAFSRALFISAWSRKIKRPVDGVVAPALVDAVAKAWNIWKFGHESNLLRLTTSLRAVVRYNSSEFERSGQKDSSHVLSLAMANLTIDSVLEMPSLMGRPNATDSVPAEQQMITVDFAPTYVGAVSSKMIHVSNPTAAAVKVRLAVAPPLHEFENYVGKDALRLPTIVREEFLTDHEAPYAQSGLKAASSMEYVNQQWWDGSGSFFLSDFWGGLVRSHYNITVRAASGALVSLLSPGLLSNAAFIAGCGYRCAVKDEVGKFDSHHDLRSTSFIGASAAEGAVPLGHQRLSKEPSSSSKGVYFKAGGSMLTGGKGPAPFAIPFFALKEEVEIPAFGEAALGPVLFRPPGRTKHMGCESSHSTVSPSHCGDEGFTSTLFLENSLTGLEKVLLRGHAVWERVVLQDVPLHEGLDRFSDMEMRNGRDALIFPGTSEFRLYGSPAVVKQLMVRNEGDIPVAFSPPFLTSTMELNRKIKLRHKGSCSLGEFTVHPCSQSNVPIRLKPGENHSFFVQHEPRCTQLSSFVALVLEYNRDENDEAGTATLFYRQHHRKNIFRKSREELLIGYRMDSTELSSCVPSGGHVVFSFLEAMNHLGFKRPENNIFEGYGMVAILAFAMTYTFIILIITAAGLILVRKLVWRLTTSSSFSKRLRGESGRPPSTESVWLSSFRLLSRGDPLSQELKNLRREQVRLGLLQQFRAQGVLPPLCLTPTGVFQRERISNPRHSGSKSGISSGGSERIRTLSDTIFNNGKMCFSAYRGLFSFGAGWKTALARGIIDDFSLERFQTNLETDQLFLLRSEHPSLASEDESAEFDSSSSADNEADSTEMSYGSHEENDTQHRQSGEFNDGDDEEEDSDSESMDENFSPEVFVTKISDRDEKAHSLQSTKTQTPVIEVSSTSRNESSEYTKVMHKGKSSKKSAKPRHNKTTDNVQKGQVTSATIETSEQSQNHSEKPGQGQASAKILAGKGPKRKVGKASNGKLSAKAPPFEPRPPVESLENKGAKAHAKDKPPSDPKPTPRLPAGLAPPPGFEGSESVRLATNAAQPAAQHRIESFSPPRNLSSSDSLPPLPDVVGDATPISGDNIAVVGSPLRPSFGVDLPTENNNLVGSLLGGPPPAAQHDSSDGFDIMDFLDGVLNEGTAQPEPAEDALTPVAEGTDLAGPSLVQVPLNPWAAATENEFGSRAAAYGINFEEDSTGAGEGVIVDLPMLTPSAILGAQDDEEKDELPSSILK